MAMSMAASAVVQPSQPLQLEIQVQQLQEDVEVAITKVSELVTLFRDTSETPSKFLSGVRGLAPESATQNNILLHALSLVEANSWAEREVLFQTKFENFVENGLAPLVEECSTQANELQHSVASVREARASFSSARERLDILHSHTETSGETPDGLDRAIAEVTSDLESHQEMMFHLLTSCNADATRLRHTYDQLLLTCYTTTVKLCCDTMDAFTQVLRGSLSVANDSLERVITTRQSLENDDLEDIRHDDFNTSLAAFGLPMHKNPPRQQQSKFPESTQGSQSVAAIDAIRGSPRSRLPARTLSQGSGSPTPRRTSIVARMGQRRKTNAGERYDSNKPISGGRTMSFDIDEDISQVALGSATHKMYRENGTSSGGGGGVQSSPLAARKKFSLSVGDEGDETDQSECDSLAATTGGPEFLSPTKSEGNMSFILEGDESLLDDDHVISSSNRPKTPSDQTNAFNQAEKSIWDVEPDHGKAAGLQTGSKNVQSTATSLHDLLVATSGTQKGEPSNMRSEAQHSKNLGNTERSHQMVSSGMQSAQQQQRERGASMPTPSLRVSVTANQSSTGGHSTATGTSARHRHREVDDVIKQAGVARDSDRSRSDSSSSESDDHNDSFHAFSSADEDEQIGHESDATSQCVSPRSSGLNSLIEGLQQSQLAEVSRVAIRRQHSPNSLFNVFDEEALGHLAVKQPRQAGANSMQPSPVKAPAALSRNPLRSVASKDQSCSAALKVRFGTASKVGRRRSQEDNHKCLISRFEQDNTEVFFGFFAVFDGHNGSDVSLELSLHFHELLLANVFFPSDCVKAIRETCIASDKHILSNEIEGGSTACLVLVFQDRLYVANVGDSEALMCRAGKATPLCNNLHKPSDPIERQRIEQAGGHVSNGRVFGMLAVARAFGDVDFKTSEGDFQSSFTGDLVTATPDINVYALDDKVDFVVIGCDGLFDVMKHQEVADFVTGQFTDGNTIEDVSESLADEAILRGSQDNVSVIIVCFNQHL